MIKKVHVRTWLSWYAFVLCLCFLSLNPIYLAILALTIFRIRMEVWRYSSSRSSQPFSSTLFLLPLMMAVFYGFLTHAGDLILFELPQSWPLIGGIITVEGFFLGFLLGFRLYLVVVLFGFFTDVLSPSVLLRSAPSLFRRNATALTIAIQALPTLANQKKDYERALKYRNLSLDSQTRWKKVRHLLTGMLEFSLERAYETAQVLEVRGFGNTARLPMHKKIFAVLFFGFGTGIFVYGLLQRSDLRILGLVVNPYTITGVSLLIVSLYWISKQMRQNLRQNLSYTTSELIFIGLLLVALSSSFFLYAYDAQPFQYDPFFQGLLPEFHMGIATLYTLAVLPYFFLFSERP